MYKKTKVLENVYFGDEQIEGIPIIHPVVKEAERLIETYWETGVINTEVVAWKAGKINNEGTRFVLPRKGENYIRDYGAKINANALDKYLNEVLNRWENGDSRIFQDLYSKVLLTNAPKNFGAVYMISLLFFLSKTQWSIYDCFAHRAAKALYMDMEPCKVYMGENSNKNDVDRVVAMYEEYTWLLIIVFGTKSISRTQDRDLWTYGHAK